jgi:uncharacterized protein (UPF0332 family)
MERALANLASARDQVRLGHAETAVFTAYYAMLYAARAALSERDLNARRHTGTWHLFHTTFVEPGSFDAALTRAAQDAQRRREAADYGAVPFELAEAAELLATAERFVAEVERLIG